jgi:hypothetical protein
VKWRKNGNTKAREGNGGESALHLSPLRRRILPGDDLDAGSGSGMGGAPGKAGNGTGKKGNVSRGDRDSDGSLEERAAEGGRAEFQRKPTIDRGTGSRVL